MRSFCPGFLLVLFACQILQAQLTVKVEEVITKRSTKVVTVTRIFDEFGSLIDENESSGEESEPVEIIVPVVVVESDAANVSVTAEDENWNSVSITKSGSGKYFLGDNVTGRVRVRVKAVDFQKNIFDERSVTVKGTAPAPNPDPTPAPDITPDDPYRSLADRIAESVRSVQSPTRSQDCKTLAAIYRSVAGRAAGLSSMDAKGMLQETRNQITAKLGSSRSNWRPWNELYVAILNDQQLGTNKSKHIKAWQEIAKGFEKAATFRYTPPLR